MAFRKALLAASILTVGGAIAAVPAMANPSAASGNPAMSCRLASMMGGQDNTEIRYTSDCRPMHSLNVVRKGPLGVARAYGEVQVPTFGGGHVIGWNGGETGGPVYAPGPSAPGAPVN